MKNKLFNFLIGFILVLTCTFVLSGCSDTNKPDNVKTFQVSDKNISFIEKNHILKTYELSSYTYVINDIKTCFVFPFKPNVNNLHAKYLSYKYSDSYNKDQLLLQNINPSIDKEKNPARLDDTYDKIILPSSNNELHLFYYFTIYYKDLRLITTFYYDTVTKECFLNDKINLDQYSFKNKLNEALLNFKTVDNKEALFYGDLLVNTPTNIDKTELKSGYSNKELYGSLYLDLELFCFQNANYKFLLDDNTTLVKTYIDTIDDVITIIKEYKNNNKIYKINTATYKVLTNN